jgi:MFS family permease
MASSKPKTGLLALASSVGTALEWYDFTIYNLMAALVFNAVFFPSYDPITGTILAFSTYAVGYVSRPLGGFVFGHLGDKLGRRFVLVATLVMMGLTTVLISALPGYASWGIWSPLALVSLRFLQGAAIGGEWAGAVLLSMEHGTDANRGRNASFAQVGPSCGSLLGTACLMITTMAMPAADFQAWGWRIPFIASAILVIFGLWVRRGVAETPVFRDLEEHKELAKAPLSEVFTKYPKRLLIAGGSRIGSDVLYALVVVFSLTYVTTVLHLPRPLALTATMIGAVLNAIAVPICGSLSDRYGRRSVYMVGAVLAIIWAFTFFVLMDSSHPVLVCLAVVGGLLIHALMYGPQAAFVAEQFPTHIRYAGASLAYTLAGIVGGGFAPLIMTTLFKSYSNTVSISIYVCIALCLTLTALIAARETANRPLEK